MKKKRIAVSLVIAAIAVTGFLSLTSTGKVVAAFVTGKSKARIHRQPPVPNFQPCSYATRGDCFSMLVIGDWGTGDDFQHTVAHAMENVALRENISTVLSTGDNFYNSGVESVHDEQWNTKWKNVYSKVHAKNGVLEWWSVLGNHDYGLNPQAQIDYSAMEPHWHMPAHFYTFTKSFSAADSSHVDVQFFMLDTELPNHADTELLAQKQVQWLDSVLKKSTARWRVVVGHHPIRSHGAHGETPYMIRTIKPLLDMYHVNAYYCGHDHDIQLLKSNEDSFECILSGGGGGARSVSYGKNTIYAHTNGGFVSTVFTRDTMHVQVHSALGKLLFAHNILATK